MTPVINHALPVIARRTASGTINATTSGSPSPHVDPYMDTVMGCLMTINIAILGCCLIVSGILGRNRLILIPTISSIAGSIASGLCYYGLHAASLYSLHARRIAIISAEIALGVQDITLLFYSYFLLNTILMGTPRKHFLLLFWLLVGGLVGTRIAITISMDRLVRGAKVTGSMNDLNLAYFVLLALAEIVSACFLLRVFYGAQKRSRSMGLSSRRIGFFSQLTRSSEVRVATLVGVGIARAACFSDGVTDTRKSIDRVAFIMGNFFPVVLLIDLLSSRITRLLAERDTGSGEDSDPESGDKWRAQAMRGWRRNNRCSMTVGVGGGIGPADTLRRDFSMYLGKGISTKDSITTSELQPPAEAKSKHT